MTLDLYDLYDLLLLTFGYWLIDGAIRRDGFVWVMSRVGVTQERFAAALWIVPCAVLAVFWRWESLPQAGVLRVFATAMTAFVAWKAATKDIDPVRGEGNDVPRLLLLVATLGCWWSPACLLITTFLLTTPFGLWQHHATMPMRMILAVLSFVCLSAGLSLTGLPFFQDTAALFFFLLTMQISHYLITALAKIMLGPKWTSWVTDNKIHHLAASAYSWGWARWFSWAQWRKVIDAIRVMERPMQFSAFTIELLAPLALLHPYAAMAFCVGWAGFHVGVFATSGLLFWEWILADLVMAYAIWMLPASVVSQVFGPIQVLIACVFMVLFPLRHKLWKPMPLGWWDTPLTQRVHWRAHGKSGEVYGVYNDFMCPHERIYGKVHGCFLAPRPVCTYHLGEVWKHELRDAIRAAGPDAQKLDGVRAEFGIDPRNEQMAAQHEAYLKAFFAALNKGARKHVLPSWLRWLKAPGGQLFHWGELPAFRGQEEVTKVTLHYREEYFDGEVLQCIHEEPVMEVVIDIEAAHEAVRELTPKEIDDYLLGLAAGKLIDLPGFGGGYVQGDDGKVRPITTQAATE